MLEDLVEFLVGQIKTSPRTVNVLSAPPVDTFDTLSCPPKRITQVLKNKGEILMPRRARIIICV